MKFLRVLQRFCASLSLMRFTDASPSITTSAFPHGSFSNTASAARGHVLGAPVLNTHPLNSGRAFFCAATLCLVPSEPVLILDIQHLLLTRLNKIAQLDRPFPINLTIRNERLPRPHAIHRHIANSPLP